MFRRSLGEASPTHEDLYWKGAEASKKTIANRRVLDIRASTVHLIEPGRELCFRKHPNLWLGNSVGNLPGVNDFSMP